MVLPAVANVTGNWKGHFKFDKATAPKEFNPAQLAKFGEGIGSLNKSKISLQVRADNTYALVLSGPTTGNKSEEGTWSLAGNQLSLVATKVSTNGRLGKNTFALSKNGRLMTEHMPGVVLSFSR